MNYFNDLNPFLVRQESDDSSAENPSDSSTNPPPITTPPNTSNTPGTGTAGAGLLCGLCISDLLPLGGQSSFGGRENLHRK